MKYVSLQPPTLLSRDGALLKKQMVEVFPALDGVFKFGPFCRPASHRSVGTGCHSNWSSSHTRAIQHCYVTTNAVQNCFSTNRALSIGVLISFEHHIDAHHINTLMHDCCHSRCDRAGWMEEVKNVVSLSLNKSYIFHHHQQRQHFSLTITYSRICASRTFIPPQYF